MTDTLVLSYHAVSPTWPAALSVTPEALDRQLALLERRGYRGATFFEAVFSPRHERTVAITFDDAYRSVLERAKPILDRYGFVGTVFVPTNYTGTGAMAWPGIDHWIGTEHEDELAPLDWEQLRALADAGWEVGSHTRSHPWLTRIDADRLDYELRGSREEIETRLARPCRSLAYPFGNHDERVMTAAGTAGYAAAATVPDRLLEIEPLQWPRVGVYHTDSDRTFRFKISPGVRRARRGWLYPPVARLVREVRGHGASSAPVA